MGWDDASGEHGAPQVLASHRMEQEEVRLPSWPTLGTWLGLAAGGVYLLAAIPAGIAVGSYLVIKEPCAAVPDCVVPRTLPQTARPC